MTPSAYDNKKAAMDQIIIEKKLKDLHYRWHFHTYLQWKGIESPYEKNMYEGYEDFLDKSTLNVISSLTDKTAEKRLKHAFIDHYVKRILTPHENDAYMWMKGAKAIIGDEAVSMNNIIPWCQKKSTYETRRIMQKETSALCKFLKKFLINYWVVLLDALKELGYETYTDYCIRKKGIDYPKWYETCVAFLKDTDELYHEVMGEWCMRRFKNPLNDLTRFDAINILSLVEFDHLYDERPLTEFLSFFSRMGMDIGKTQGLYPDIENDPAKNSQAMCFPMRIPEEVRIVMRPEGGLVDIETLAHELGHGLFAAHTPASLPIWEKELAPSQNLSEAFAFLFQNMTFSRPFLHKYVGLDEKTAETLYYHKTVKDFALFRRYAAKMASEFEMFETGDMETGARYAEIMKNATGFYHQPESCLFDLTPEYYCLDYLLGWMGESVIENRLRNSVGDDWMFTDKTGATLMELWKNGNRFDIITFIEERFNTTLSYEPLLNKWISVFNKGC